MMLGCGVCVDRINTVDRSANRFKERKKTLFVYIVKAEQLYFFDFFCENNQHISGSGPPHCDQG